MRCDDGETTRRTKNSVTAVKYVKKLLPGVQACVASIFLSLVGSAFKRTLFRLKWSIFI